MIPLLDTHQHLIYPDQWPYSWTNGVAPLKNQSFRIEDYRREIEGTGIEATVFMETTPDNWREEAGFVYQLAGRENSLIRGVVANCHPEETGFEPYLASIQHPQLVGLRRICHTEADDFSQNPRFIENVRRLGSLNLTFDLCFLARQLPFATELARKCPDVQFILDHCGVPDIAAGALDPWRENIRQIAALANVVCKISGVLAYCQPQNASTEAVRPYVEHCLESFGWDRVVWGSDWPVCNLTTTLRDWVKISREIVHNAAESDQHKLFHRNAARIYRLET